MSKPTRKQKLIIQRTLEHAVAAVSDIPSAALAEFLPLLEEAKKHLVRDLKIWELKHAGADAYTAHKMRSALYQIEGALQEIRELGPAMTTTLTGSSSIAAKAAMDAMEQQLIALDTIFTGAAVPVSIDRAAVLAKGEGLLFKKYPESGAHYAGAIGDEVRKRLALGTLKQQSISEMKDDMFKAIPEVFKGARYRAERLIRSEVMESYNTFHHESLIDAHEEDDDIKMRWDASYDFRRCPICADLDGRIVEVDGQFKASWTTAGGKGKSATYQRPPAHPQCRCVLVPWIEEWPSYDWPDRDPPADQTVEA